MKTIGVDLHKDSLTVVALDESGQCERREKLVNPQSMCAIQGGKEVNPVR